MTALPILTAETIIAEAIRNSLAGLVGTYQTRPKVYYQLAEQGAPLPYVVYQLQSDIGRLDWVDDTGAGVLVTVKALATSASGARSLLNTVAAGMDSLSYTGYVVLARYLRSPGIPPSDGVFQSAHIYRIKIART